MREHLWASAILKARLGPRGKDLGSEEWKTLWWEGLQFNPLLGTWRKNNCKSCGVLGGVFYFSADDPSLPILIFHQNMKNAFREVFFLGAWSSKLEPDLRVHQDLSRVSVAPLASPYSVNFLLRGFLWIYTQNYPCLMFVVGSFPTD